MPTAKTKSPAAKTTKSRTRAKPAAEKPPIEEIIALLPTVSTDPVAVAEVGGPVVWQNKAMAERLDTLGDDKPRDVLLADIIAQAREIEAPSETGMASVENTEEMADGTIMLVDTDGRQAWYIASVSKIDQDGKSLEVFNFFDVSAIKHREQNLIEANSMTEHRLNHDAQTGLPNRRKLLTELRGALRRQSEGAWVGVIVVEILQFKELTSLHGPEAADEVIQEVVVCLLECLGDDEIVVGRTESNEFVIIFENCASTEALQAHAERVHESLRISIPLETGPYSVLTRLATVLADREGVRPNKLMIDPLVALHHPDTPQSVFIRPYDEEMRVKLENRAKVFSELKDALENDEIEPFYQPQIRLEDGQAFGFEVLARWRHPERGLMPPGLFLPIAEDTGLLPAIDDQIMQKSIKALAGWRAEGYEELRISLNASGDALRDETFPDRLIMELDKYDMTPAAASVEILESVLIEDDEDVAAKTIETLRRSGFHLELDDFGTGYASISTLITLKVDTIKLDRSLIKDLCTKEDSFNIVKSTLALANQLGVESLAEGVEDQAQMAILREFRCHYAQGFGIARPMPHGETTEWLHKKLRQPASDVA